MSNMNNDVKLRAALTYLHAGNKYAAALRNEFVYRDHASTNIALTMRQAQEQQSAARAWAQAMNAAMEQLSQTKKG